MTMIHLLLNEYQDYIAEILAPLGLCHTYNIAFSHDLLNLNLTSSDFHYQYDQKFDLSLKKINNHPPTKFPHKVSTSKAGLWVGFDQRAKLEKNFIQNDFTGYVVLLHDPYELPSKNSHTMRINIKLQNKILIIPQIIAIDESLVGYKPAE